MHLQLAVALYRFGTYGNGSSSMQTATKFGISIGSVQNFTNRVIKLLVGLSNRYIQWPNQQARKHIGSDMSAKVLPKCIGFVDGTDIAFSTAPLDNKEVYWSRKKKYCMQAQIICDPSRRIIDLFTGYPGSVHDAKVYGFSPPGCFPNKFFSPGEFLVGDSAYALTETVIVPFRRTNAGLTQTQKAFNRHISSQRVAVEHTIGILKGRFQSLKELRVIISKDAGHKRACEWIQACAVLHNFLLEQGDEWEELECVVFGNDAADIQYDINYPEHKKGQHKRQALLEIYLALQ